MVTSTVPAGTQQAATLNPLLQQGNNQNRAGNTNDGASRQTDLDTAGTATGAQRQDNVTNVTGQTDTIAQLVNAAETGQEPPERFANAERGELLDIVV